MTSTTTPVEEGYIKIDLAVLAVCKDVSARSNPSLQSRLFLHVFAVPARSCRVWSYHTRGPSVVFCIANALTQLPFSLVVFV